MAEKKSTTKAKPARKTTKPKSLCTAKLSDGSPCPKNAEVSKTFCRWHDPEDETWREVYARLEKSTPEEKADIVLGLIEDHPEHRLVLPERDGQKANLYSIDLSCETLDKRRNQFDAEEPSWWSIEFNRAELSGANLQGAILTRAILEGASLVAANFQNTDLRWGNLKGAILRGANFQEAKLSLANLSKTHIQNSDFRQSDLSAANLSEANLRFSNLQGADLHLANLQGADFTDSDLQQANLQHAKLQGAKLSNANLQGVQLWGANLQGAFLESANLKNAGLSGTKLQEAFMVGADLQSADLRDADLQNAILSDANLQNARLGRSNLQGAILTDSNLQHADLRDASLHQIDFSRVSDMTSVYISGAWLERNRMRYELFGGAIGEELTKDYTAAKRGYLALKQNFNDLGDYEAASWAYRKERRMEKLEARKKAKDATKTYKMHKFKIKQGKPEFSTLPKERNWKEAISSYFKYVSDTLVEWLCDYGESVWRVIGWLVLILFIAEPLLFSLAGGFYWDKNLAQEFLSLHSPWNKFWFSYRLHILYSLSTLGSNSFSGFLPANYYVEFAASLFSVVDIFLVGLLGFVAGNRIRRS